MTDWNRLVVLCAALTAAITLEASIAGAGVCSGCGKNSATIVDGVVFDELNVKGLRRRGGPKIDWVAFETAPTPTNSVQLSVDGDELVARDRGTEFRGAQLAGLLITLSATNGSIFQLRIAGAFERLRFWAAPDGPVPAYDIWVRKARSTRPTPLPDSWSPFERLCTGKYVEPTVKSVPGQEFTALVFTGDHYTATNNVTTEKLDWFYLACFGSAAAKMHLLRHTAAGAAPNTPPTTLRQRTAMLRAITADYCGDGRAWTGEGTPLWWTEKGQTFPLAIQPAYTQSSFRSQIEAVWGLDGKLLCLNEPRRTPASGRPTPDCSKPAVPRSVVVKGAVACRKGHEIPACSDFVWQQYTTTPWDASPLLPNTATSRSELDTAYVITVNPGGPVDYCNSDPQGVIAWP